VVIFGIQYSAYSFIYVTPFPLGRVAGTAAPGGVEISCSYQQSHVVLLAPNQCEIKQGRRWITPPGRCRPLGFLSAGLAWKTCLADLSWFILDTRPNQR